MKKTIYLTIGAILIACAFYGGRYYENTYPKYVSLYSLKELDGLTITEIYLNEVYDTRFNFKKTWELISADFFPVLPAKEPDKIRQILECLKNADQLASAGEGDADSLIFFKTRHNIYYTSIGWDNEKFYGHYWESKELMDLIKQWKQETSNRIKEGRTRAGIKQLAICDTFEHFRLSYPRFDKRPLKDLSQQERDEWEKEVKSGYVKYIEERRKEHAKNMETDDVYRRIWTELVEQGTISSQIGTDIE